MINETRHAMHGTRCIVTVLTLALIYLGVLPTAAQHAPGADHPYEWPEDPAVREKLDKWQDQKFGMIIHWGLYAVPGIIESWALCSEDWIYRDSTSDYNDFKTWYWGLKDQFNPEAFNPDQWAAAAHSAGMRYVVFTTKHHDGFSMFDTKQTTFSIAHGPFASHPKKDVAKHVFNVFRERDFMIGAYFSKPDWHSEYYWWTRYATPDRNNNYDIRKNRWRWNKFREFTYNQIEELMTGYGAMDILWLDGGWVRPLETVNDEVRAWGARIPEWSQDIGMDRIAAMARRNQPGLLVVDRTVHGTYENYRTPEQNVPEKRLDYPWESCITLGNAWGHVANDEYKSAAKLIHLLTEIVAKGGNLLLGVGPGPDGTLNYKQVTRLKEIGAWLEVNGEAIYGTRSIEKYQDGKTFFTKGKDGRIYAIVLLNEGDAVPEKVTWTVNFPKQGSEMRLLSGNRKVSWRRNGDAVSVNVPATVRRSSQPALVFSFIPKE